MAEKPTTPPPSQSHNPSAIPPLFRDLFEEPVQRMAGLVEELARMEARTFEQIRAGIDESARLTKETLSYLATLAAQWRKMMLEGMQQAAAAAPLGQPPSASGIRA